MRFSWLLFIFLLACKTPHITIQKDVELATTPIAKTASQVKQHQKSSTHGKFFTPHGNLRALVIYVDFEASTLDHKIHDNLGYWPLGEEFPVQYNQSIVQNNQLVWGYEEATQFDDFKLEDAKKLNNLSEFYYAMSDKKFRFYFETLKHPETNKAISLKIDPKGIPANTNGRNELNKRVFEAIRELYPKDYDWSRFDTRVNRPNYEKAHLENVDISSSYADYQLDFVLLLFRNSPFWKSHPTGNPNGVAWRKAILGTGANEIIGYDGETPIKVSNEGLRIFNTQRNLFVELELLIHEIGHAMISLPHYTKANKAEGNYLLYPNGWGMMDTYSKTFSLANAWERWYSGWTEITHDISPNNATNGVYKLQDYLTKGESMRIQHPQNKDEFVWIEYRSEPNPFYGRPLHNRDRDRKPILLEQLGVFAFTEKVASSREETFGTNVNGTNGIIPLYGKGNHDLTFDDYYLREYAYNNKVVNVFDKGENPYGGQNEAMYFRHDFNNNGQIERKTGSNGAGSQYIDAQSIYEIEQDIVRGHLMPHTPIKNKSISAFTNPAITNFQQMDWNKNELSPIYLHSLSVEFSENTNQTLEVKVNYQDGIIKEHFRMTNKIILPKDVHIRLAKNIRLTLNKSKTLNRVKAIEGDFIEASSFTLASGGSFTMEENSTWLITEESHVIFETDAIFEMKANSLLQIEDALIEVYESTKLKLHPSAKVKYQNQEFSAEEFFSGIVKASSE